MADSPAPEGRPERGPDSPPPNAFRPLPGNARGRIGGDSAGGSRGPAAPTDAAAPFPAAPNPTAELLAHRLTAGTVAPLLGSRVLVELPTLVADVRRGHRITVPLTLAQIALVVAPAAASALPRPSAFRRTVVCASIASWPLTVASSFAAAKGAKLPLQLAAYAAGTTSALASVSGAGPGAAINAVAQSTYIGVVKHLTSGNRGAAALFSATIMPAAMTLPFVFLAQAIILRSREHDAIARSTAASAIAADRLSAADAEATRFNALLHDQVLAVLKAVKMNAPASDVRRTTRVALRLTERGGVDAARGGRVYGNAGAGYGNGRAIGSRNVIPGVAPEELAAALRRTILSATPDCRVESSASGPPVPTDVAAALESALLQVAANSARHAGEGVTRTCDISIRPDGIDLRFADDGRGFDPAGVPHDRLGLRTSIRDRLHSLGGATVRVDSRPGGGTVVDFQWTPEPTSAIPLSLADSVVRQTTLSVLVGGAITTQMWLEGSSRRHPVAATAGWAAGMAALHIQRDSPAGKPSMPRTAAMIGLATAGTLIPALAGIRTSNPQAPAWHEYAFGSALGLIGARGRPGLAIGSSLAWMAGKLAVARPRRWKDVESASHVPAVVLSGAVARLGLHAVNRRVEQARTAERRLLDIVGRRHAENRVREANRAWLDDVAGAFLRRIRRLPGEYVTDEDRMMAGLLDARIRDSLRSPRLDRPDVTRLAWELRARGVTVLLVDDRGDRAEVPDPPGLLDRVADSFAEIAAHAVAEGIADGRLTVRLLPPGRANAATIVLSPETAEPRRVSIPA